MAAELPFPTPLPLLVVAVVRLVAVLPAGSVRTVDKILSHYIVHIYGTPMWMEHVRLDEVCDVIRKTSIS